MDNKERKPEEYFCPLKMINKPLNEELTPCGSFNCEGAECAWWNKNPKGCAIPALVSWVSAIGGE